MKELQIRDVPRLILTYDTLSVEPDCRDRLPRVPSGNPAYFGDGSLLLAAFDEGDHPTVEFALLHKEQHHLEIAAPIAFYVTGVAALEQLHRYLGLILDQYERDVLP